jgi:iron complex outermembrane receptor protein
MNTPSLSARSAGRILSFFGFVSALLLGTMSGRAAEPAAPGAAPGARPDGGALVLSPFEVVSERDHGYTASNTLAGGRLATDLRDTPASITVLTREFLDDIGGGDFRSALQYAPNAIPVGDSDTGTGAIGTTRAGGNQAETSPTSVRIRGIAESRATRNFFVWNINSDNYNTERIDIARGPNTLIFGDAGSGGAANLTTKKARLDRAFESVTLRHVSYGGGRASLDVNRPLGATLALRANAVYAREDGWRAIERYEREGVYLAGLWKPWAQTQVQADFEWGHTKNFVPYNVTRDNISAWDGRYIVTAPLAGTAGPAAATGAARFDSVARPDYWVFTVGRESEGLVNWRGFARTNGNDSSLESGRLSPAAPAGVRPLTFDGRAAAPAADGTRYYGVLPHRGWNHTPANRNFDTDYNATTLTVTQRVGRSLFFDLGYAHQEDYRHQFSPGQANQVYLDLNTVLPSGAPNPNFLRPFTDYDNTRIDYLTGDYDEVRLSGAYKLSTRLTDQTIGFFASSRWNESYNRIFRGRRTNNPAFPNIGHAANQIVWRVYLDRNNAPIDLTRTGTFNGVDIGWVETSGGGGTGSHGRSTADTAQLFAAGSWLEGRRLKTLVGLRRDVTKAKGYTPVLDPVFGLKRGYELTSARSTAQTSPTAGLVYELGGGFSGYANYAESFLAASGGQRKLDGSVNDPRSGKGWEAGLKFELWRNRVSGSLAYYDQVESNNPISVLGANTSDLVGVNTTSVGVNLNAIAAALGQASFTNGNYNDVQETSGTGWEFELTANLARGWSLLANFSLPEVQQQNSLADTRTFVAANRENWTRAAAALGPATAATVASQLAQVDGHLAQFADGRASSGVADYTANLFSRYRFMEGRLKGAYFGGGVNVRGRRVAGVQTDRSVLYSSGYPLVNALLGYDTTWRTRTVRAQLNVTNLLDEAYPRYTAYYTNAGGVQPYIFTQQPPRKYQLTLTLDF